MNSQFKLLILLTLIAPALFGYSKNDIVPDVKYYLIRLDDMGMSHGVNMAVKQVIETGLPVSTSIMFTCPWYQEAVDILKPHPEVSVGIHLTLNAEWQNYRWGPVVGREAVPSLVDSLGYFLPARSLLFSRNPDVAEIEKELRAQIERAMSCGLKIDYVDYHMGAAVQTLELREIVEGLAAEHELGLVYYLGEQSSSATYFPEYDAKLDSLLSNITTLEPGINLQVVHVSLDTPEMQAMIDLNTFGLKEMSKHRFSELQAITSPVFRDALQTNNIKPITYGDLIKMVGLENMQRPPQE
ncbi:MAG: ChbG/HpnK family deacetylase [Candidatus Marinimicrobia bacterium]|nr:ChbG/HpnK family deacetylase [Candidatus Neomarinimicrobiota bacterium]